MTLEIWQKLWRFVQSRKLALLLLLALVLFIAIGVIIPQKNFDNQQYSLWATNWPQLASTFSYLGLDSVFSAWYFYLIIFILFVNTLLCSVKQIKFLVRRNIEQPLMHNQNLCSSHITIEQSSETKTIEKITRFFQQRRFNIHQDNEKNTTIIIARKGQIYRWGIVIFHLSFLLILGSVFYGTLTMMEGVVYLGTGETFTERQQDYYKLKHGILFSTDNHLGFQMTLKDTKLNYVQGYPEINQLNLTFWDNATGTHNYQVKQGEETVFQGIRIFRDNVGYAPALVFTDKKNQIVFSSIQELPTVFYPGNRVAYKDVLQVERLKLKAELEFYPDAVIEGQKIYNKSQEPKNPVLYLKVFQGSHIIYDGAVKIGERVKLEDNLFLNYPEYRNWVSFRLVRDNSATGIFAGFAISVFGLALYYLIIPQNYQVSIVNLNGVTTVSIYGCTDKFIEVFKAKYGTTVENLIKELLGREVALVCINGKLSCYGQL